MKAILKSIIIILMIFLLSFDVLAEEHHHDEHMCEVIFGYNETRCTSTDKGAKALEALEAASFLCLDLTNQEPKGSTCLQTLKDYHVYGLPSSVKDIMFSSNQYHRRYTHFGWECGYKQDDKGNWNARKSLLVGTVTKIFSFKSDEQAESFGAFIYYVHVLGDYLYCNSYTDTLNMIALAYEHPGSTNRDLFYDLQYHIPIMLAENKVQGKNKYYAFTGELNTIAEEARSLVAQTGGIRTDEQFEEYKGYATKLMTLLKDYMPELLHNEPYFSEIFY